MLPGMTKTRHMLSVTDAGGLIATVPRLLGFQPEESIVVLCVRSKTMGPAMRADLPPMREVAPLADHLARQSVRHADAVALLVFSGRRDARKALARVLEAMLATGMAVIDAIVVDGDTAMFLPDRNGRSRDPVSVPGSQDAFVARLDAETAFAGRSVLPNRAALEASVRAPRASKLRRARQAMKQAREQAYPECGDLASTEAPFHSILDSALAEFDRQRSVAPVTAATLALLAQDTTIRDLMIGRIIDDRQTDWLPALISAVVQVPGDESEDLCAILASAAYRSGDGALAQVSVDRCLQTRPDHRLAELLQDIMSAGLAPSILDALGADLVRQELLDDQYWDAGGYRSM